MEKYFVYGFELPETKGLNIEKTLEKELRIIRTNEGKMIYGEILKTLPENGILEEEGILQLMEKSTNCEWHPRFISYLENKIRLHSIDNRFVIKPKILLVTGEN